MGSRGRHASVLRTTPQKSVAVCATTPRVEFYTRQEIPSSSIGTDTSALYDLTHHLLSAASHVPWLETPEQVVQVQVVQVQVVWSCPRVLISLQQRG